MTPIALLAVALAPFFEEHTELLGAQPCGPGPATGCYSHYVALADLDGDGDLDIVFASGGGYYQAATAAPMAVYLGDGAGGFTDASASAFGGFTGRVRQVAVGDIDGDGDLDVIAPDSWALQPDAVFVNDGQSPPTFTGEGAARLGTSSRAAGARLGDLDGDGDLDLVLTDWGDAPPASPGTARVYANDGAGVFSEVPGAVPQDTAAMGTGPIDCDLFDADGDLDLDLLLASRVGESLLFVNDGAGRFASASDRLPDQPGPYVYGPDPCDVDGDGDLDVWLDNGAASLGEQLVINDGAGSFADETAARVTGNPGADDNEVQCADLDGDGDLDAVIASLSDEERVLENDGAGRFALSPGAFPAVGDSTLGLDLGDVDGDGRLDAVTAQGEATPYLNRLYLGVAPQPVDTRPPRFRAVQVVPDGARGAITVRFAVVDASTTDAGPRLRSAHLEVDYQPGGDVVPARFAGGDLYQAVLDAPPDVDVSYRACATDAAGNQACSEPVTFHSGATPDAGAPSASDAGPGGTGGGGCGCRAAPRGGPGALALLVAAALALITRACARPRRAGPRSRDAARSRARAAARRDRARPARS